MLRAFMCAAGPEQMVADATFAVAHEASREPVPRHCVVVAGRGSPAHRPPGRGPRPVRRGIRHRRPMGSSDTIGICEAQLAWLAMDRGEWAEAAGRLESALATIEESRMHDFVFTIPAFTGAARLSVHRSDLNDAHRQLTRAMRARPSATYLLPYHAVRLRLQLAKIYLAIADPGTVHQLLREIDDILARRPALGALVDEVKDFRSVLASGAVSKPPARCR